MRARRVEEFSNPEWFPVDEVQIYTCQLGLGHRLPDAAHGRAVRAWAPAAPSPAAAMQASVAVPSEGESEAEGETPYEWHLILVDAAIDWLAPDAHGPMSLCPLLERDRHRLHR